MKNQSNLKGSKAPQIKGSLKLLVIGFIPLVTGLVLGRAATLVPAISPAIEVGHNLSDYTVIWGPRSFDEAVWRAVERIATLEVTSPTRVERFQVEIRSSQDTYPPIVLAFDRIALEHLIAGKLAPEVFIRERVQFD